MRAALLLLTAVAAAALVAAAPAAAGAPVAAAMPAAAPPAAAVANATWAEHLRTSWWMRGPLDLPGWHKALSLANGMQGLVPGACAAAEQLLTFQSSCRPSRHGSRQPVPRQPPMPPSLPCKLRLVTVLCEFMDDASKRAGSGQLGPSNSTASLQKMLEKRPLLGTMLQNAMCLLQMNCPAVAEVSGVAP